MPNLSIPEITKDGKEYRSVLLVEKTFEKNGKTYERKLNPNRSYISREAKWYNC